MSTTATKETPGHTAPAPAGFGGLQAKSSAALSANVRVAIRPPVLAARSPGQSFETAVSFEVMNSSSAGTPWRVCSIPRRMAGTISPGSVTRSP